MITMAMIWFGSRCRPLAFIGLRVTIWRRCEHSRRRDIRRSRRGHVGGRYGSHLVSAQFIYMSHSSPHSNGHLSKAKSTRWCGMYRQTIQNLDHGCVAIREKRCKRVAHVSGIAHLLSYLVLQLAVFLVRFTPSRSSPRQRFSHLRALPYPTDRACEMTTVPPAKVPAGLAVRWRSRKCRRKR